MKTKYWLLIGVTLLCLQDIQAQGPPITADKPIMLARGNVIVKTLTSIRQSNEGSLVHIPLMAHYIPSRNLLFAIHLPYHFYEVEIGSFQNSGNGLGDIELVGKYQFLRIDRTHQTFRVVAKTQQTFPTSKKLGFHAIQSGIYQAYYGLTAGFERLYHGISAELGYRYKHGFGDEWVAKAGFGLPLLKPTYPVKQINLYFEYHSAYTPEYDEFVLYYAQGIQYAKGRLTLEAAVQIPIIESIPEHEKLNYNILLGSRYIF